jgi:hypothetical protein
VQKERVKQGRVHVWRHACMPAKLQFCGMLQKSRKRQATFWTLLTPQRLPVLALHNASMNVSVNFMFSESNTWIKLTYRVSLLMLPFSCMVLTHGSLFGFEGTKPGKSISFVFPFRPHWYAQQNTWVLSNLLKLWSLLMQTRQSRLGNSTLVGAFIHHQKPLLVH